ncbi:hypothetical protein V2G26_010274 [Clonostachys chloroleuca]
MKVHIIALPSPQIAFHPYSHNLLNGKYTELFPRLDSSTQYICAPPPFPGPCLTSDRSSIDGTEGPRHPSRGRRMFIKVPFRISKTRNGKRANTGRVSTVCLPSPAMEGDVVLTF